MPTPHRDPKQRFSRVALCRLSPWATVWRSLGLPQPARGALGKPLHHLSLSSPVGRAPSLWGCGEGEEPGCKENTPHPERSFCFVKGGGLTHSEPRHLGSVLLPPFHALSGSPRPGFPWVPRTRRAGCRPRARAPAVPSIWNARSAGSCLSCRSGPVTC